MSAQPKTLFLINSFAVGGAERVFIDDMKKLRAEGWDVHAAVLFAPGKLAPELEDARIPLHELSFTSAFDPKGVSRLKQLTLDLGCTQVLSTLNEANLAGRLARLGGARFRLVTREANLASDKHWKYKLGDMLFGAFSARIIAVSRAVGESVCAYAPWLRSRMVVVYNGTNVPPAVPQRSHEGTVRLLSVGSLTPKKDQAVLIRAIKLLPSEFTLTLVGQGKEEGQLRLLAEREGAADRVEFAGYVPHTRIREVYDSHDLFVLPSAREGCPNVVSEAQAAGLAVVAFDIPGMSEFVSSESGVLVKERSAEALAQGIRTAAASRQEMGARGYEEVRNLRSVETHLRGLRSVLDA